MYWRNTGSIPVGNTDYEYASVAQLEAGNTFRPYTVRVQISSEAPSRNTQKEGKPLYLGLTESRDFRSEQASPGRDRSL